MSKKTGKGAPGRTPSSLKYKISAPLRLWVKTRAGETQQSKPPLAGSKKRSAAAVTAADTKRAALLEEVDKWQPKIRIPNGDLVRRARDAYARNQMEHGRRDYDQDGFSPEFVRRIVGNYLRHECSDYEAKLASIRGRVGEGEAYEELKRAVMARLDAAIEHTLAEAGLLQRWRDE